MIGKGIEINNIHTYKDLGVSILSKTIGAPDLNRITESIPFMDGVYDFSELYGSETYGERILQYEFDLSDISKERMNIKKIKLINFFRNNSNSMLKDDTIRGYLFNFKRMITHTFKEKGLEGKLSVSLATYPYKVCEQEEGNKTWDNFNFELDILQDTKFNVLGTKEVSIYNSSSTNITPVIVCDSTFRVLKNNNEYMFSAGETKDYRFELNVGENKLTLNGNGNIFIKFRKEVL